MPAGFTILIADRNRHVCDFLRRELTAEGYHVEVTKDGRDVLRRIKGEKLPDLLILDLEIPYVGGLVILEGLREHHPELPVVIHTFPTEDASHDVVQSAAAFVEKRGDTNRLKATVRETLNRFYPQRSQSELSKKLTERTEKTT